MIKTTTQFVVHFVCIGVKTMDLKEVSNNVLEIMIYEAIHEMNDREYLKKLLDERKRRSLDE